jgi:hypothetical protein
MPLERSELGRLVISVFDSQNVYIGEHVRIFIKRESKFRFQLHIEAPKTVKINKQQKPYTGWEDSIAVDELNR